MVWDMDPLGVDALERMRRENDRAVQKEMQAMQEETLARTKAIAAALEASAAKSKNEPAEEPIEMPRELLDAIAIVNDETPDHKTVKVLASEVFPVSTAIAQKKRRMADVMSAVAGLKNKKPLPMKKPIAGPKL